MSGDNTEQKPPATAPAKSDKPTAPAAAKKARQPGRGAGLLAFLALLVAVAALAASGWLVREDYLSGDQEDPALQRLRQDIQALGEQQRSLTSSLEASRESQREALAQLRSDQQRQLSDLLARSQQLESAVDQLATVDRRDWLIAEAEYLLRLANQRLQLGRDARAAAQLLASADQVLV